MRLRRGVRPVANGTPRIRLGVSSCLLGEKVRYDGRHKRDRFLTDVLGAHFDFVPVCPELEVGLGVPREPVHLIAGAAGPSRVRLVGVQSATDHTRAMQGWAARRIAALAALDLAGYVFKEGSPSCGLYRVPVANGARASRDGVGLFARAFRDALPLVPVEEEGRLYDARLRDAFLERIFALDRLRALGSDLSRGALVELHARHRVLLLAHGRSRVRALGRLVAAAKTQRPRALYASYAAGFVAALERPATRKGHVSALVHMLGELEDHLAGRDLQELRGAIAEYAAGRSPRIVPITLLEHHARRHGIRALADQHYLTPDPRERMLRAHA